MGWTSGDFPQIEVIPQTSRLGLHRPADSWCQDRLYLRGLWVAVSTPTSARRATLQTSHATLRCRGLASAVSASGCPGVPRARGRRRQEDPARPRACTCVDARSDIIRRARVEGPFQWPLRLEGGHGGACGRRRCLTSAKQVCWPRTRCERFWGERCTC